jgi:hypothetical protein
MAAAAPNDYPRCAFLPSPRAGLQAWDLAATASEDPGETLSKQQKQLCLGERGASLKVGRQLY